MGVGLRRFYAAECRIRDLFLASLGLVLTLPLLLVFGLAAGLSSGASPIFKQIRVGRDGRHFLIYKLRTLYPTAPARVHCKEAEHMATPLGRFLRTRKIDELPQLWNVIKGDMSLVGPRPIIPEEYGEAPDGLRLTVRPGLSGLWQLSSVRDHRFDENPEYDLFYLVNCSFSFDAWLIWRTILLLVTGKDTTIKVASRIWERDDSWRHLAPDREMAIPPRQDSGWEFEVAHLAICSEHDPV